MNYKILQFIFQINFLFKLSFYFSGLKYSYKKFVFKCEFIRNLEEISNKIMILIQLKLNKNISKFSTCDSNSLLSIICFEL